MWRELAEYARWAPSPHNTQPSRLRIVDDERAEVLFVPERGLPVGDPLGKFTQLTFGIFVEALRIAAHARGHELEVTYAGEPLYAVRRPLQKVAELRLIPRGEPISDFDPQLLLRRRTNRHPYNDRPLPVDVISELEDETRRYGHSSSRSRNSTVTRCTTIWPMPPTAGNSAPGCATPRRRPAGRVTGCRLGRWSCRACC
jgi:hypothetical protein